LAKNQPFEVLQRGVAASASRKIADLTFMRALGNWNEPVFGSVLDQSRVIEPTARADLLKWNKS
jgi:hypothetical protein